MKICIIIPSFYPAVVYGGWVFSSLNTCRELAKLGIDSYVSTTNDNGHTPLPFNSSDYRKLEDKIFVKYYPQTFKEKFSFSMLFQLWKDIKAADIIHIQGIFSAPTPLSLFYALLFKKKVLLSPHGCLGDWCLADGSKYKKLYLKLFVKPYSEKITWHATSKQENEEILSLFPKAKVEVIPNGINIREFDHLNRFTKTEYIKKLIGKEMNVENILITMSRLHKKKGIDILIDAFHLLIKKYPHSILFIAGDDFGEKEKLEKQILNLRLENKVFFVGHLKDQDRIDFFANGDVFVLPSHNENFGLVFAEAMAAETPIIASKGTPWEEVEKLRIGRWVENTPFQTARAMEDLLSKDLKKLGIESKRFIESNYSWESIGKKFKKLFQSMHLENE